MSSIQLTSLAQIEKGELQKAHDEAITKAFAELVKHRREHGEEPTAGAKAEIVLKITIKPQIVNKKIQEGGYVVTSDLSIKTPARPQGVSLAQHMLIKGKDTIHVTDRDPGENEDQRRQQSLLPVADNILPLKDAKSRAAGENEPAPGPYASKN